MCLAVLYWYWNLYMYCTDCVLQFLQVATRTTQEEAQVNLSLSLTPWKTRGSVTKIGRKLPSKKITC